MTKYLEALAGGIIFFFAIVLAVGDTPDNIGLIAGLIGGTFIAGLLAWGVVLDERNK